MFIWAHRGASSIAPENTIKAFEQAIQAQADGIELDVQVVENIPVVLHDAWLQQTTNGIGHVTQVAFGYLQSLDAGDGQSVPTLRDVLMHINGRCKINIELKAADCEALILADIEYALEHSAVTADDILVSSFNHRMLARFAKLAPAIRLGALTANLPLSLAEFATELGAWSVHCARDFIDQDFVQDAHQRGLKVFVYTINHAEDMEKMHQLGVDGIFTDYPTRARQLFSVVEPSSAS
ncbi:glycerophosphodiester phosphodiesterase [Catenovulum sediminis]|uniref:Glycerophosphodiester phosphodiesterase family protein n=1 Tax=Catenovulum sediminis TaxID=1740262 RepID=A0ABV1RH23_9ALTE|nr:glycerophosphodiester phosphodiesterase family protein [Catenovulum sediminis]